MSKLQLKRVRAQLGLSQRALAEQAGISEQTVIEAERGRRQIRLISAYAILNALNEARRQRGLSELDIDSLDWNVES
jgi:DNA-binding XRE family transcriptional regulator